MNKINDGGPAFPNVPEGAGSRWADWDMGMTLRDYFAAKAMAAVWRDIHDDVDRAQALIELGVHAYEMADAMLAARGAQ
ncbi:hypothetical protein [Achromobacter xylosoxidans]|uniref:hypothetical protein n=1 Tax=Alcaligenes xylosoxydans xylosoxydans TaxID=85698 RepID=UPI0006C71E8C|nr:hypothetical protein [Achromobacter xylosoxidans]CUI55794.1 Uncharacterised protein [Achromobacter xylosoxidans]